MIKPSYNWDPNSTTTPTSTQANMTPTFTTKENLKLGHSRIPSVVLSPSPSSVSPLAENNKPLDINLTLDTSSIPTASSESSALSTYHSTISQPGLWDRLYSFLRYAYFIFGIEYPLIEPAELNSQTRTMRSSPLRISYVQAKAH